MAHVRKVMGVILALAMVFSIATVNASALFNPKPTKAISNIVDAIHLITDAKVTDAPNLGGLITGIIAGDATADTVCPVVSSIADIIKIGDCDIKLPTIGGITLPEGTDCKITELLKKVVADLGSKGLVLGKDYGITLTPVCENGKIGYTVTITGLVNEFTRENFIVIDLEKRTVTWDRSWDFSLLFGIIEKEVSKSDTIKCPFAPTETTTKPAEDTTTATTKPAKETTTKAPTTDTIIEEPVDIVDDTPLADVTVTDNTPLSDIEIANTGDSAPAIIGAVSLLAAAAFVTARKVG